MYNASPGAGAYEAWTKDPDDPRSRDTTWTGTGTAKPEPDPAPRPGLGEALATKEVVQRLFGTPDRAAMPDLDAAEPGPSADRIAELEKQLADTQSAALRSRVQAKHGISDEDAALFLTATDEDTLTKQAERLAGRGSAGLDDPDALRSAARRLFTNHKEH